MKHIQFICIVTILLSAVSFSFARDGKADGTKHESLHELRGDLRVQLLEMELLEQTLRRQITSQIETIKEQDSQIVDMRLKVNDLENSFFQITQSLRNLELEVWDMKEAFKERSDKKRRPMSN